MQNRMKTNHNHSGERIILTIFSGLLTGAVLFTVFILSFSRSYFEKIYPKIEVSGLNIGGMTKDEAAKFLTEKLKYPTDSAFSFTYGKDIWYATPEDLGMQIQIDATVEKAWNIGRMGDAAEQIRDRVAAFLFKVDLKPVLLVDERVGFKWISSLAGYIDKPMEQPAITLNGSQVNITPGKSGLAVDREMALTLLQIYGRNLQTASIEIPVKELKPSTSNLESQQKVLESLLSQDFSVYTADEAGTKVIWKISADMLAGWIDFQPVVENDSVTIAMIPKREPFYNKLVAIGQSIYQEPQNARFVFNDNTKEIEPIMEAVIGKELDVEATLKNITDAIQAGQHQAQAVEKITQPQVTSSAKGSDLGIKELVESQYTYFFHSDDARVQNITAGAASFHGLLVAPGEIFSMDDHLGNIDVDNGYAEAAVIFGDQTIQGVGGGICQVSTTLFRTAFFYGLPIVERHAHAYRVFYYERQANGEIDPTMAGMDATVYAPLLDMKFKNDTPYWILMETYVRPENSSIQWKFYSTKVNRYVDWKTSGLTNVVKEGEPSYRENPDLPAGTVNQVDWGVDGADITINRTVYQDGAAIIQDEFDTHYQAWSDTFEYGPGTPGMPPNGTQADEETAQTN